MNVIGMGFTGSMAAGSMTVVGALGVFMVRKLSERLEDGLLGFAAGVMLAASFFSLILPAIDYAEMLKYSREGAVLIVVAGLLCGALESSNGNLKWQLNTGKAITGAPVLAGEQLYIGSRDGKLYALQPRSGKLSWQFDAGAPISKSVLPADGMIFFSTDRGALFALE